MKTVIVLLCIISLNSLSSDGRISNTQSDKCRQVEETANCCTALGCCCLGLPIGLGLWISKGLPVMQVFLAIPVSVGLVTGLIGGSCVVAGKYVHDYTQSHTIVSDSINQPLLVPTQNSNTQPPNTQNWTDTEAADARNNTSYSPYTPSPLVSYSSYLEKEE